MNVTINGEPVDLPEGTTLAAILEQRGQSTGVATAVNGEFVPRSARSTHAVSDGDTVDIVAPMQGG